MSKPEDKTPRTTIRIGLDMFEDVEDFIVLIRGKDNGITARTSSQCWAHGAMEKMIVEIEANNIREAGEGDDE